MRIENIPSEQGILKTMLLSDKKVKYVFDNITEEDFSSNQNKIIFKKLKEKFLETGNIDITCLDSNLIAIASEMMATSYVAGDMAEQYIENVKDCAFRRKISENLSKIKAVAENSDKKELKKEMQSLLANFPEKNIKKTKEDVIDSFYEKFCEGYDKEEKETVKTIPFLDEFIFGIEPSQFVVLAGRPATGKTAFALQMAVESAERGKRTVFFTLEMGEGECFSRIISRGEKIENWKIQKQLINNNEFIRITEGVESLRKIPLDIQTVGRLSVDMIEQYIIEAKINDETPDIIFIDYLQLLSGEGSSRYEKISNISQGIKNLALEYNIAIVSLAQFNRESMKGSVKPNLHELKDSGSIEQDANIVLGIWGKDDEEINGERDIFLSILKNRNGELKDIPCVFEKKYQNFKKAIL